MKILLIEDDLEMQELLHDYLLNFDFEVDSFANPLEALKVLNTNHNYSLVVLDLMLPHLDGFDVCKKIRQKSTIPIIISSARGNLGDKIVAFEYGADDYLAKPYEPKELVIRINAILRRITTTPTVTKVGEFEIDEDRFQITQEGHLLELTNIEYEIFTFLLTNKDKVLSREAITSFLGNEYSNIKHRAIDMHISNIRTKICDDSKNAKYIKSVWGIGYKFIG